MPVKLAEIRVEVPRTVASIVEQEVGLSHIHLVVDALYDPKQGNVPIVFEVNCINN